jgi:hypothetical protein
MTTEHLPPRQPEPRPADTSDLDAARRSLRVQLLAQEHWSLLSTRSLSWSESFTRAGMFLTMLTGSVVALALVAQATQFGAGFLLFAVLVLPVVLFVGVATFVRLVEVNTEDVVWVKGMNRLRRAYLEIDPGLEPYLITGWTEDPAGILRTYGSAETSGSLLHGLITTPAMIGFVNAMLAAVLAALVLGQVGMSMALAAVGGIGAFALASVASWIFVLRASAPHFVTGDVAGPDSDSTPA